MFMKYLIKLEDRNSGREAFVECPANMPLEELNVKIKVALRLPYVDYEAHWFLMQGKIYVQDKDRTHFVYDDDPYDYLPVSQSLVSQYRINYPRDCDFRDSNRYTLKQVFTTKGSIITYKQDIEYSNDHTYDGYPDVRCTLIDRIP